MNSRKYPTLLRSVVCGFLTTVEKKKMWRLAASNSPNRRVEGYYLKINPNMELSIILRCLFIAVFLVLFWSNCLASVDGNSVQEAPENDMGIPFCSPEVAQRHPNRWVLFCFFHSSPPVWRNMAPQWDCHLIKFKNCVVKFYLRLSDPEAS